MSETKRLKIGEGKISGYLSIFLAIVSLGFVICAYFPDVFTTKDFRDIYNPQIVKWSILAVLILSFIFAFTSLILSKKKRYGFISTIIIAATILLGSALPEGTSIQDKAFTIGLDWLLIDVLVSAIVFIPIELFLPKRSNQSKFHSEWRTDLVYFIVSHLFIQMIGVIVQFPAVTMFKNIGLEGFQNTIQSIPFLPQLFVALLVSDLFQYTAHYVFHKVPYLWRFHAVHHSTKNLDWLAGSRTHFFDLVVVRAMSFIPIYVCGFDSSVFFTYIVIVSFQAVLAHANTRINFGFLKYIFVTPQYHHWHHSDDPKAYDKNFAIHFPFIDMIFGTYYPIGNDWPEGTGLGDVKYPKGFARQFVYPFVKNPQEHHNLKDPSER
ncbi:sterol desaturase family protein [Psychroserpens luteolus]|uniref:sterol desaturase family protein n=1 Tax=Psychroserpens luteolus TaxID=2855840 RepID=UPI001E45C36E|nr:sterol desaturase family protein [Psychroserpens luteolus]MCD2259638.1 sterol desaturase family protein [Psychroserpens luteolus]